MKKIFPCLCILGFITASAQQSDPFDIEKHIQEKIKRHHSVQRGRPFQLLNPRINRFEKNSLPQAKLLHVLINSNKVYALPQDNMPCIVPDMSQFQRMPNIAILKKDIFPPNEKIPGQIPNASPPMKLIPDSK